MRTVSSEVVYGERLLKLSKPNFGSFKAFIKTSGDKMQRKNNTCLLSCRLKKEVYSLYCMERASQSAKESEGGKKIIVSFL